MKKRITAVLSLILAFVMCFALVACNGETDNTGNNNNTPDTKPIATVSADKVATAFERFSEVAGFKGEAKISFSSDKTNDEYTLSFDKRGDRVKCTVGDASYILDLESGNMYSTLSDGKYGYRQYLPIGMLDYVEYMLSELPMPDGEKDLSDIKLSYDAATKTATYSKDIASKLNDYIEPITDAYDMGKSVKALINAYIAMKNEDLNVDVILRLLPAYRDVKLDDLLSLMTTMGFDDDAVAAIRTAIEENLDAETVAKLYDRKAGEIVAGLYDFISEMMGSQIAVVDETTPDNGNEGGASEIIGGIADMRPAIEEMLGALLDAVLNREYTAEQVTDAFNKLIPLINSTLDNISVKNIVDEYVPNISDELYAAIKNEVRFNKLSAEFNVGLETNGDAYTVTGFEFTAQCKHNYKGDVGEGWTLLADNNYKAVITVDIGEYYTTAPADFDITVSPDAVQSQVLALVYGIQNDDYVVKLEYGVNTVTGVTVDGAVAICDDEPVELQLSIDGTVATLDGATGLIKIEQRFINSAFTLIAHGEADASSDAVCVDKLVISVTLLTPGDDVKLDIVFIKMPDTVDGLFELIKSSVSGLPDVDEPIEGETEIE